MRSYITIFGFILLISIISTGCKKTPENNPPVITSVSLSPKIVKPDSSAIVAVKASDNDGDLIVYSYLPSAGIIIGNGSNVRWVAPDSIGTYSLIVKASDDKGGVTIDSSARLEVREVVTPTQLKGTATFRNGLTGDLSNSRVALYASKADWISGFPQDTLMTKSGSFSIINFTMDNIAPGNYYVDIWKDNDNSFTHSNGDFLGWYGSGDLFNPQPDPVHISEGETTEIIIQMYIY